jgi:hypothetical protein
VLVPLARRQSKVSRNVGHRFADTDFRLDNQGAHIMKTLKMKTLAAAFAALATGGAHAAIVTQWTVDVDAKFLPGSIVDSNGSTPGGVAISDADRKLRWGTDIGNGQSGLDITNSPASAVVTTGIGVVLPPVANISVTHINKTIQEPSLDKVTLSSALTLTPFAPALPGLPTQTLNFLIDFQETTNNATPCADGGNNGEGVNINGCGDIFVIDQDALNFSFFYDTDGPGGDPEQEYFISFVELTGGLNPLPDAACAAVGVANNCLGFRTAEAADTTFQFGSLITTERVTVNVPEPGMLGLLGLGLAALGFSQRRKI